MYSLELQETGGKLMDFFGAFLHCYNLLSAFVAQTPATMQTARQMFQYYSIMFQLPINIDKNTRDANKDGREHW